MPRPTPTPACSSTTRNWPFGYSEKIRPHRHALAASASLAALLCAATLMPGSAEAACPAPVNGTITVTPSTTGCTSIGFNSHPAETNLIVQEGASMITSSVNLLWGNGVVGNLTINGTLENATGRVLNFNPGAAATTRMGAITFGQSAVVRAPRDMIADLRNIPEIGPITLAGTLTTNSAVMSIGGVSTTNKGVTLKGDFYSTATASSFFTFFEVYNGTVKGSITNSGLVTTRGPQGYGLRARGTSLSH